MTLADCQVTIAARPDAGIDARQGHTIVCPQLGCPGAPATVEESRPDGTHGRARDAWRIINCQRCGRTTYRSTQTVDIIADPPTVGPAAGQTAARVGVPDPVAMLAASGRPPTNPPWRSFEELTAGPTVQPAEDPLLAAARQQQSSATPNRR